jgi:CTP synthase
MRQFQFRVGPENFALIYVSLIPVVGGEQKTKPTQAGVRDLRGLGLLPDLVSSSLIFLSGSQADI